MQRNSRLPPCASKKPIYAPAPNYTRVDYLQSHWKRRKDLIAAHPELANLPKHDPMNAFWTMFCVGIMMASAYALRNSSLPFALMVAYFFGCFVDHALWVLIHDLTHNLAFPIAHLNTIFLIICNIPHIVPSAVSFRYYHRLHHSHLNETYADPDIPGPKESEFFGRTAFGKMCWLFLFPLMQISRTLRFTNNIFNVWMALNWISALGFGAFVFQYWGAVSLTYLVVSSLFAIGFHPIGTRWIAEHYAVAPAQETYSYYGPLNTIAFNIGYHNEHHDLPDVPWSCLPKVRAGAPEFYEGLYTHKSYLGLLMKFFFDPQFTLCTRLVRTPSTKLTSE